MKNFIIICLIGYITMTNLYGHDYTVIINSLIDIFNKILNLIITLILSIK